MASVHEVIEAFRQAPTNVERGTKFEQLMVRYLELDPMLSQQYDKVWRWIDWPGRDGKPDTGIDLVARERDMQTMVDQLASANLDATPRPDASAQSSPPT